MISLLVKRSIVRSFRRFNLIQMIIIQWLLVTPLVPSSRFSLLRLSVDVCIVAYLLIFCTYYKVFPRKKLKRFWIPYLLYMIVVYIYRFWEWLGFLYCINRLLHAVGLANTLRWTLFLCCDVYLLLFYFKTEYTKSNTLRV